jgi:hypothetical protein
MILQANTIKELETQIKETNPRFIQLVNSQGTTFTVWNRSAQDRDEKAKEIIKILQSNNTPEDVYFIDARMTRQKPNMNFKFIKGNPAQAAQEPAAPMFANSAPNNKEAQDIISNKELLELRVENEALKMKLENLQSIIDDYEAEADSLDDAPPPPPSNAWKELAETLMPALDAVVGTWKQSVETKQMELAMKYQQAQERTPAPQVIQAPQMLTLEQLEAVKQSAPNDFYAWYAEPQNREYYENLKAS